MPRFFPFHPSPEYSPTNFQVTPEDREPFLRSPSGSVDLLESITPAAKGQAVPHIQIWEIDPATGRAMHANDDGSPRAPLSLTLVTPPRFGISVGDQRFRERPPVSLERLSIKSQNPRGIILYRIIELSFVVHRPDVVFSDHIEVIVDPDKTVRYKHRDEPDSWASLLIPGQVFLLEYGWSTSSGVKNGILDGSGFSDPGNQLFVTGRQQVRFVVTNYRFNILADNQISFTILGYEDGEVNRRRAFLIEPPDAKSEKKTGVRDVINDPDPYDETRSIKDLLKVVQNQISTPAVAQKNAKKHTRVVQFGKLFDEVFARKFKESATSLGYELAGIFIGRFNHKCGKPIDRYGGGGNMSDRPISDFTFPLDEIEKTFQSLIEVGHRLTLDNFIKPFIDMFSTSEMWNRNDKSFANSTTPQIRMRTVTRRRTDGKTEMAIHIFDAVREFTRFTDDDKKKLPHPTASREEVKKIVTERGVPFVSLVRGNSYIQSADFDTVKDDQMAGILMRRYLSPDRTQKVQSPDILTKERVFATPQQIYSPVIQGNITMVGNFVFDVFALLWLEFGVRQWDGPFFMFEKEDVIDRTGFTTTIRVQSAGTDPLGTQGRNTT